MVVPVSIFKALYLDNLRHTITKFSRWKRLEERRINENVLWLPEGTDEVLAMRRIYGCLSTNAGVHHRQ